MFTPSGRNTSCNRRTNGSHAEQTVVDCPVLFARHGIKTEDAVSGAGTDQLVRAISGLVNEWHGIAHVDGDQFCCPFLFARPAVERHHAAFAWRFAFVKLICLLRIVQDHQVLVDHRRCTEPVLTLPRAKVNAPRFCAVVIEGFEQCFLWG